MNLTRRLSYCALFAPIVMAPGEAEIEFGPEPDTSLQKSFQTAFDFSLEDFSLVVDGEDIGAIMGGFDFSMAIEQSLEVTDAYVSVGEGRPLHLMRTFDTLDNLVNVDVTSEFGGENEEIPSVSELEGRTVHFRWNEESSEYEIGFEDDEGEESLLRGLTEDMDLRVLLPSGAVSEGDTWNVPIKDLQSIAAPGGNLHLLPEDADLGDFSAMEEMFSEKFGDIGDLFEGQWVCTFQGLSAEDARLAEISFESTVEASVDFSEMILDVIDLFAEEAGEDEIPDITVDTADVAFEFEGSGTLIWNTADGHFHSFDLNGDTVISVDLAVSVEVAGESHAAEMYMEMSGSYEHDVSTGE